MSLIDKIRARLEAGLLQTTASRGTASSDALTINALAGIITTETKSTAAAGTYAITLTNTRIVRGDIVVAHVLKNSNGGGNGTAVVTGIVVTNNQVVITVTNIHGSAAFNGAHTIGFKVFK